MPCEEGAEVAGAPTRIAGGTGPDPRLHAAAARITASTTARANASRPRVHPLHRDKDQGISLGTAKGYGQKRGLGVRFRRASLGEDAETAVLSDAIGLKSAKRYGRIGAAAAGTTTKMNATRPGAAGRSSTTSAEITDY